jgi:hypothetical protein
MTGAGPSALPSHAVPDIGLQKIVPPAAVRSIRFQIGGR